MSEIKIPELNPKQIGKLGHLLLAGKDIPEVYLSYPDMAALGIQCILAREKVESELTVWNEQFPTRSRTNEKKKINGLIETDYIHLSDNREPHLLGSEMYAVVERLGRKAEHFIDALYSDASGEHIVIVDWKFTETLKENQHLPKYDTQMINYQNTIFDCLPKVSTVDAWLVYISMPKHKDGVTFIWIHKMKTLKRTVMKDALELNKKSETTRVQTRSQTLDQSNYKKQKFQQIRAHCLMFQIKNRIADSISMAMVDIEKSDIQDNSKQSQEENNEYDISDSVTVNSIELYERLLWMQISALKWESSRFWQERKIYDLISIPRVQELFWPHAEDLLQVLIFDLNLWDKERLFLTGQPSKKSNLYGKYGRFEEQDFMEIICLDKTWNLLQTYYASLNMDESILQLGYFMLSTFLIVYTFVADVKIRARGFVHFVINDVIDTGMQQQALENNQAWTAYRTTLPQRLPFFEDF